MAVAAMDVAGLAVTDLANNPSMTTYTAWRTTTGILGDGLVLASGAVIQASHEQSKSNPLLNLY